MQSKTSSFDGRTPFFSATLLRKNLSRFWPLWLSYAVIWALLVPVDLFLQLRSQRIYSDAVPTLIDLSQTILGRSVGGAPFLALLFGCLMTMALFSYLCTARSVGFLHTLPIRRSGLFWTNYLSGLIMFFSTHAVTALLTVLALAASGTEIPMGSILLAFAISSCLTVLFFSLGTVCAMFTGQVLAIPVFYAAANILFAGMEFLIRTLSGIFLYGYDPSSAGSFTALSRWLSPLIRLEQELGVSVTYDATYSNPTTVEVSGLETVWIYGVAGLVLAAVAAWLYLHRKSESAGDTVAVGWAKPIFKYGVAICAALSLGQGLYIITYLQYGSGGSSTSAMIVCMLITGLVGYFAAEMLLRKTFRVLRGAWKGAVATAAVLVLFTLSVSMDFYGLERKIPDADSVQRVDFQLWGVYPSAEGSTDSPELIEALQEVHSRCIAEKDIQLQRVDENNNFYSIDYVSSGDAPYDTVQIELTYQLPGGSALSREYTIFYTDEDLQDPSSALYALSAFFAQPEAVKAYLLDEEDAAMVTQGEYEYPHFYGNSVSTEWYSLSTEQAQAVAQAVMEDIEAGRVYLDLTADESYYNNLSLYYNTNTHNYFEIPLLSSMTATLQALQETGVATEERPLVLQEEVDTMFSDDKTSVESTEASDGVVTGIIGGADGPTEIVVAQTEEAA